MARYRAEHKRETRERILEAADRVIKDRGIDRASVDAVMRSADLTVGGFYAHFASKEELAQEGLLFGLERSMERILTPLASIDDDRAWVSVLIRHYLRQVDEPSLAAACPLTVLLPEVARGGASFQRAFGARTAALLDRIESRFPEVAGLSRRDVAAFVFSSCAGAVALARAIGAPRARERILRGTEAMLAALLGLDPPERPVPPV
ncbi:MAG: TetR/AcrR family transcriptional regulator [Betaproteobacteria bacterium]